MSNWFDWQSIHDLADCLLLDHPIKLVVFLFFIKQAKYLRKSVHYKDNKQLGSGMESTLVLSPAEEGDGMRIGSSSF